MIRNHTLLFAAVALTSGLALAAKKAPAPPATCDRECLQKLADTYLASLVAHDASKLPFAADVKIVENVKAIKPGEGLWKTTTAGPSDFKIVVPDPYAQEVGGMVMMQTTASRRRLASG